MPQEESGLIGWGWRKIGGQGEEFFFRPWNLAIPGGSTDEGDFFRADRIGLVAPLAADVSQDGRDLFILQGYRRAVSPGRHVVIV